MTTPSSLDVPAGGMVPFAAHAVRKDGFAGDVASRLVGAPEGFALSGARIPAGRDMVRATLSAPLRGTTAGPFPLRMEARARIGDRTVVRPVVPSQDMMQAFAYRHLAASQDLLVAVLPGGRPWPALDRMGSGPVRLSPGGSALVRFASPIRAMPEGFRLELSEPPPGVVLEEVAVTSGVLALILRAEASAKPGPQDNPRGFDRSRRAATHGDRRQDAPPMPPGSRSATSVAATRGQRV